MRIKIGIDFEVPPRVKRLLLWAIPVSILAAGGIAWASLPHSFVSGETLTAANLNSDLQNLDSRVATIESIRTVYAAVASNGTLTYEAPSGWATATSTFGGTCSNTQDLTLTFAVPFSAPPVCTVDSNPTMIRTITATSIQLYCAVGDQPNGFTVLCAGPP
jgi:hypothetical protein